MAFDLNSKFKIDEVISVTLVKPKTKAFPIGKTDKGVTCLISRQIKKKNYDYNSVWDCKIVKISKSCLIIEPLLQTKSAKEASAELEDSLARLKSGDHNFIISK